MAHNDDFIRRIRQELRIVETLSDLVRGKWKLAILWILKYGPIRFGEIHRILNSITQTTLTRKLSELDADGMIIRKVYPEVPPKVEYSLTSEGAELVAHLEDMVPWIQQYRTRHPDSGMTGPDKPSAEV